MITSDELNLRRVPRFGKTPMIMEHIKTMLCGEPVPRFKLADINIGKIEPDPKIFTVPESPIPKSAHDWSRHFEEELLRFADRFKTRRVYVLNCLGISARDIKRDKGLLDEIRMPLEAKSETSRDERFKITWYQKFFTYDNRADAYYMAKHLHGNVTWYDFKRIVDLPLDGVWLIPSPNVQLAIELWKTFNTCAICHAEYRCKTVLFRGKQDRVCIKCLEKYCHFNRR